MEYLELGKIVNTHGIKGEIKIKPYTDNIEQFKDFKTLMLQSKNKEVLELNVQSVKFFKGNVIIKLETIDDVDKANTLREDIVLVEKDNSKLEQGQYYIVDLLDCKVLDEQGKYLGVLIDIFNNGSADVYEVKLENNKKILLPAIEDCIKKIDIEKKEITVCILEGLENEV